MYKMTEIKEDPEIYKRRKSGPHVNQLRAFMESGKVFVKLEDMPSEKVRKEYRGLWTASRRPEFRGLVTVKRYGTIIQLIRQG